MVRSSYHADKQAAGEDVVGQFQPSKK
jgi:hypothetical protein